MKISDSTVAMNSYSTLQQSKKTEISTKTTYHGDGFENSTTTGVTYSSYGFKYQSSAAVFSSSKKDGFAITDANQLYDKENEVKDETEKDNEAVSDSAGRNLAASHTGSIGNSLSSLLDYDDPKIEMLKSMLKLISGASGKKLSLAERLEKVKGISLSANQSINVSAFKLSIANQSTTTSSSGENRWTKQVSESGYEEGNQSLSFTSKGTAVTEDGREISFNMTLEMSESFAKAYSITGEEEEFKVVDPLVINLKNDSAEVSDTHFFFDLNADGKDEEISQLKSGSGFLALDKNKDGKINNGSELFGAKTGDGFGELAKYDDDKNGWIDENDKVFGELSIWLKDDDGTDKLVALGDAGVGAIFLGSQKGDYALRDSSDNESAYIRSTGMYLSENGSAGTIQHIDFRA